MATRSFYSVLEKFLNVAPIWRLVCSMDSKHSTKKAEVRPRTNLRLDPNVWNAIDVARKKRPGNVSRNSWIAEAVIEKLARDSNRDSENEQGGGHDA